MSKTVVYTVRVEFGHCDPARIVWFPNFFRWIDAASRHFFVECGVPPWHETEKTSGLIGTPVVDTHTKFVKTATYGDVLEFHTTIPEWRGKSFVQRYRAVRRNKDGSEDLILETNEVRIFAARRADDPEQIKAIEIPPEIRRLCE